MRVARWFYAVLLSGLMLTVLGCRKTEKEDKEAETEPQVPETISFEITDEMVCRFIAGKIGEMATIPGLGDFGLLIGTEWNWPIEGPKVQMSQIKDDFDKEYEAELNRYEDNELAAFREKIEAEIEAEHPMYKKGDKITLVLYGGRSASSNVDGKLVTVGKDRVQISSRMILRDDIDPEERQKIFPDEHEALVKRLTTSRVTTARLEFEEKLRDQYEDKLRQAWLQEGYVPNILLGKKQGRINEKNWIGKLALLKRVQQFLQCPAGKAYENDLLQ